MGKPRNALRDIISEREEELPVSTMGRLIQIAEEAKDVISLGPGEPDFVSPPHVLRAVKKAMDKGLTHYSPPAGRADLREAIVKKLRKQNGVDVGPEQVVVTTGSTEGILLSLMCIMDPGEAVMFQDPGFLAYRPTVEILNGVPVSVPLSASENWLPTYEGLEEAIVPEKTVAIIVNSPSNPTGAVFTKKVWGEIADFAVEHDLLIISDEAYEAFVYDDAKHISPAAINGLEDRVITLQTCSKTWAMPGFRVGWAAGPENVISAMTKLHLFSTVCAPTVSQVAALAALAGPQIAVGKMVKEYNRRRMLVTKRLDEMDIPCEVPKGAFYAWPDISEFKMKSLAFSQRLLDQAKVAVVPGTEFGRRGEGFVRLSYATAYKKIETAMDRIEKFCENVRKK